MDEPTQRRMVAASWNNSPPHYKEDARRFLDLAGAKLVEAVSCINDAERCFSEVDGKEVVERLSDCMSDLRGLIKQLGYDPAHLEGMSTKPNVRAAE